MNDNDGIAGAALPARHVVVVQAPGEGHKAAIRVALLQPGRALKQRIAEKNAPRRKVDKAPVDHRLELSWILKPVRQSLARQQVPYHPGRPVSG